ncbi:DUF3108 domain-containing protein [Desulforhopalus sp. 52FAK]
MDYRKKIISVGCCLTIVCSTVFFNNPSFAETLVDSSQVTERKTSSGELDILSEFDPTPGTYYYDVFLKGTKLGRASIAVDRTGDEYVVAVKARTRGILKHLYKVKYKGEVAVTRNPLLPQTAKIIEQTGRKKKTINAEFESHDRIVVTEEEVKGNNPAKVKTKEYESESFILDPFSIVFLIRSLDWQVGTSEVFDLFTGTKQYEIHLLCPEETALTIDGVLRPCWVIVPETRTLKEPREVKMSGFKIYLSKDERKEILKITGDPKIGRIVADLRKFEKREE